MHHLQLIAQTLKVVDKRGRLVALKANPQQVAIMEAIRTQAGTGHPVRIIGLKARQIGFSTITEAVMFLRCQTEPNRKALVSAHTDDSSEALFRMARIFEAEFPRALRQRTEYSSRKEITWAAPHRSSFMVQTAGRKALARSLTLHMFHASEVAFWSNPTESLTSALQSVPDSPDTMVILESTANGMGGEFYERWTTATDYRRRNPDALDGYTPLFFSWLDFPEYSMTVPEVGLGSLTSAEQALVERGAKPEQLYWRRVTIRDRLNGDEALFAQEFPATPEEAFLVSGRPALPVEAVRHHAAIVRDPERRRLRIVGDKVEAVPANGDTNCWQVWHPPQENQKYTAAADLAEGTLSDTNNSASDPDYSAIAVFNRTTNRIDAVWHGRMDADLVAEELWKAGNWYNTAWITPEINGPGLAALLHLKRLKYRRIYKRQRHDDRIVREYSEQLGWRTTQSNRDQLIDDWITAIQPDGEGKFDRSLKVLSSQLVSEEQSFVYKPNGKREHARGKHDDILFAAMIAYQIHMRVAMGRGGAQPTRRPRMPINMVGAIDPGIEFDRPGRVPQTG